jgi:hypothetical protein
LLEHGDVAVAFDRIDACSGGAVLMTWSGFPFE